MGNICAGGINSSHARSTYDEYVHTTPDRQAQSTPMAGQSPLHGLPPRTPGRAGPSEPPAGLEKWDKKIRSRVTGLAHDLFEYTGCRIDALNSNYQQSIIKQLEDMLARVSGENIIGGDDFNEKVERLKNKIGDKPEQSFVSLVETEQDSDTLKKMKGLVGRIDVALMGAKNGGEDGLMDMVACPTASRSELAIASNMVGGYETGIIAPKDEEMLRVQNLLKSIEEGQQGQFVRKGVAIAVRESKGNPRVLHTKLLALVRQYPNFKE
ncbi:hypothetical protein [Xanthomonas fragariae]|uniref:hypothetical protein n=1 Tax=Xanthomonas fragariae TaxID=48664 RepID=UPI0022A9FD04|nr:hypothetical protein [Xanthomonas fragariae]WAT15116.1 hypothetical protein OZ429_00640 [Xanthomonas fragariae]